MNSSRSFDRAASFYDQTRPLPESIAKPGVQAILEITGSEARILDVGTGTGRISTPLLKQGLDLIGCDLSFRMLLRLREKLPFARIAQADATTLPFPSAYFDIVMTAHVLHLVPAWREAVQEFRRVLTPGGAYLNLKTWANVGVSVREQMRLHWRGWLALHGVNAELPGLQANTEMQEELQSLGAQLTEVEVAHYSLLFTLREELERFARRIYSDSWEIPDPIFEASVEELETWAAHEYGDLDQQRQDEVRFSIDVARFAG